ncbi:unnamed protein product [Oppiella nova]|uniref:Cytochrome P450 n=1 Tax=Oppiella nova TaxID=334625 RepID=A0A7R9M9Q8_9ACAR|nr:unnamed protein product [Oppiella nova]CAG2173422.1 unnamed protein product [Oppiella nova]
MFSIQVLLNYLLENVVYFTLFAVFISLVRHLVMSYVSRMKLPAGPRGLPFVGYLPFLGKKPHKDIAKLSDKYGSVFTLQLGVHNVVILNDWESVKEAFNNDDFLGKPTSSVFTVGNPTTSFVDDSGQVWRDHRRFALQVLRDLGFGKGSMEDRMTDEISYLTKLIDETNGEPMNIHKVLVPSMSNNISNLVFGRRLEFEDPSRQAMDKMLDQVAKSLNIIGLLGTTPEWLGKLIFIVGAIGSKKKFDVVSGIFDKEISSHQKSFNVNNRVNDYIDGYLAEMEVRQRKDPNTHFTLAKLGENSRAFFGAGSETVRTSAEWLLLLVVKYSEHQKRIHSEIDSVVGRDRSPCYADRLHMPFTQAFINEMFRWKTILPLNLMRRTLKDTTVLGHFIPKDTRVMANIWAVHNDPKVWDKPEQFNPNRFLTSDGKELLKTEALIPFSYGKRSCVGETLARVQVFLYFVLLLQKYTISAANDEVLTLDDNFGLTLQPKDPMVLRFRKRV